MANSDFSITNLIPDFSLLFQATGDGAELLSAGFVLMIWSLFLLFICLATIAFVKAKGKVRFYLKLISVLTPDNLAEKRRELSQKAMQQSDELGMLWREFDESLVHSEIKPHLRNTLDAGHFFSTSTLSRKLTENRLMSAIPGLLTAIGVIGTFVGLSLGLRSLQLDSDAGIEALQDGIKNMIAGAAVAFITSVWGVIASALFNLYEKILERSIRGDIFYLQNSIDSLYPRITAEQSLVNIAETGKNTDEAIQGLAEKLGDKMQEAMNEASLTISSSLESALNNIMEPAINSLVSNANNGAQNAIEGLVTEFMESMGQAGQLQRDAMNQASSSVSDAMTSMGSEMNGFLDKLDGQTGQMGDMLSSQFETMNSREKTRNDELKNQMDQLISSSETVVQNLTNDIQQQWNVQQEQDQSRQTDISNTVSGFQTAQQGLMDEVNTLLAEQQKNSTSLIDKVGALESRLAQLADANQNAASELNSATQNMQGTSNQLGMMSSKVQEATTALGSVVENSSATLKNIMTSSKEMIDQFSNIASLIEESQKDMLNVSGDLKVASQHAESGFKAVDNHLMGFTQKMKEQVEELENQAARLLTEFASQVSDQTSHRMTEWNNHTNEYSNSMTSAVRAIQGVVDEIETRVGVRA